MHFASQLKSSAQLWTTSFKVHIPSDDTWVGVVGVVTIWSCVRARSRALQKIESKLRDYYRK